ncbi:MAG: hypothetical protein OXB88_10145 [Bacteriovoracales bacterium]|nr:hypothetical protein [Bacteriovoracales bacterium]
MQEQKQKEKVKKDSLVWINPETGASYHAGAAFYMEKYGFFKLILDGPKTIFYLTPYRVEDKKIKYRVLAPVIIRGKISHKVEMGYGERASGKNGDIIMTIGRYAPMRLILKLKSEV